MFSILKVRKWKMRSSVQNYLYLILVKGHHATTYFHSTSAKFRSRNVLKLFLEWKLKFEILLTFEVSGYNRFWQVYINLKNITTTFLVKEVIIEVLTIIMYHDCKILKFRNYKRIWKVFRHVSYHYIEVYIRLEDM